MDYRLLGPLEVVGPDGPLRLGGPKQRALLAILLIHANVVVSVDGLMDELWGESPPKTAAAYLQNCVSRLRKSLGATTLDTRPPGYALRVDPDDVDALRFERLAQEARTLEAVERAPALRAALALWHGPALADFAFEHFAQAEALRLEELRLATLESRIDAELELGLHDELTGELDALTARHPSRERLRELQLLALYRAGRQTDALRAYQEARLALVEELGIEPGERLKALERMILAHDPLLDPVPRPHAARPVAGDARRTVAALCVELAVPDGAEPEHARAIASRCLAEAPAIVERHGGTIDVLEDEIVAVFGVPVSREDDALRALRAAVDVRAAIEREGAAARIGVEAGELSADGAAGSAAASARRLAAGAGAGQVVLGPLALRLAGGAIEVVSLGDGVYRLLDVVHGAPAVARHLDARLVGRGAELAQLEAAVDEVAAARACRRVLVVGDAGMGKTRLAAELATAVAERALVLSGTCVAYGEGATYRPLAEALRAGADGAGIHLRVANALAGDPDAERAAEALAAATSGAPGGASASDVHWATRRLLEALARERPVVLVLDDVHLAEDVFLDLVEYVLGWSSDAPIVLLCLARPELLEARPDWGEGALELAPLGDDEARELVEALPVSAQVDDDALAAVLSTAEGNPLFLEQLTAAAAEQGVTPGVVPPTIEAVLASRLDRLGPGERAVLERAAVAGNEFWRGAVDAITVDDEERDAVSRRLMALVRRRLVRPDRSTLLGEDAFRFHHALVRDVAYAAIPGGARGELHERLARWLEARPDAPDELVGFHLEQAYRYGAERGDADEALAREAAGRLGEAGRRAIFRLDDRSAVGLLRRATSLLGAETDGRLELEIELGYAVKNVGEMAAAMAILSDCAEKARERGERRLELRARVELAWPRLSAGAVSADDVLALVREALPVFQASADGYGVARAEHVRANIEVGLRIRCAEAEEAARTANEQYRRSGASGSCDAVLAHAWLNGPTPVSEAIDGCARILLDTSTQRLMLPYVEGVTAELEAMQGSIDSARERLRRAASAHREHGHDFALQTTWTMALAAVETLAGDHAAAEALLAAACAQLRDSEEGWWYATHAASLARAILAQGRVDEALELAEESEAVAVADDLFPQTLWRQVRARALARRGAAEEAERLARDAIALLGSTDAVNHRADALVTLATVLDSAGRPCEALIYADDAVALYEQKGNLVAAERARELRAQLVAGGR